MNRYLNLRALKNRQPGEKLSDTRKRLRAKHADRKTPSDDFRPAEKWPRFDEELKF
jgi:hypothetical protein